MNAPGQHTCEARLELGYARQVCGLCGSDWPCSMIAQARDYATNGDIDGPTVFYEAGEQAHADGRPDAPALDSVVRAGLGVLGPDYKELSHETATEIMQAFRDGYEAARQTELRALR